MSRKGNAMKDFGRAGSIALLMGCLWLSTAPAMFAQVQGNDAALQSNVTNALSNDAALKGQQVTATVSQGQVTLTGTVQTNAERQEAETAAANVQGVSGILNNLTVKDANSPVPTAAANADQQDAVTQNSGVQNTAQDQTPAPPADAQQQAAPTPAQTNQNQSNQGYTAPPPPPDATRPQYQPQQPYGYPQQPSRYQQGYAPPPQQPSGPVTVPTGTLLRVRLNENLDTKNLKDGAYFQATAAADVYQGGVLAIPRGAVITGQVVESKDGGALGGSATLRLNLTSLNLEGRTYPIVTDVWSNKGPNKAGYTAANTVGGAAIGAIIGGIVGRGAGAAIGAGVGAGAGLATSAATSGPRLVLPVETQVDFHITAPVTVLPVSWQEAQRLASASTPQQPTLVRRPVYYRPYPYGYPPPPYYGYPY